MVKTAVVRVLPSAKGCRDLLPPKKKKTRILRWTRKEADAYENEDENEDYYKRQQGTTKNNFIEVSLANLLNRSKKNILANLPK